jgi:hypothetical protein
VTFLTNILRWLFSLRRERVLDKRDATKTIAVELDKLAELMSEVLKVTSSNGSLQQDKLPELELMRRRIWDRWISILSSESYEKQDPKSRAELEKCIRIAHAAPGAYVEEIYLVQMSIAEGFVRNDVRERFAKSIDAIRNATTRLRLNA